MARRYRYHTSSFGYNQSLPSLDVLVKSTMITTRWYRYTLAPTGFLNHRRATSLSLFHFLFLILRRPAPARGIRGMLRGKGARASMPIPRVIWLKINHPSFHVWRMVIKTKRRVVVSTPSLLLGGLRGEARPEDIRGTQARRNARPRL